MNVIFGCDCHCNNHGSENNAPVAFLVERNGKELKVCTHCDLSSDRKIARLFDEQTIMAPFLEYDALGAFVMLAFLDDKFWTEKMLENK